MAPSMSPIGSQDGPVAQDPMVLVERGNARAGGSNDIPPLLRRSGRNSQAPARMTYDAGFTQNETRATAGQPPASRRGRNQPNAGVVPAPVDDPAMDFQPPSRRGTRNRRTPNRLTYDANGNQIG